MWSISIFLVDENVKKSNYLFSWLNWNTLEKGSNHCQKPTTQVSWNIPLTRQHQETIQRPNLWNWSWYFFLWATPHPFRPNCPTKTYSTMTSTNTPTRCICAGMEQNVKTMYYCSSWQNYTMDFILFEHRSRSSQIGDSMLHNIT